MNEEFLTTFGALLAISSTIVSLLAVVYKLAKTEANIYTAIARLENKFFEALDRQQDKILAKIAPLEQTLTLQLRDMAFKHNELLAHVRDIEQFLEQKDGYSPRTPITYDK